MTSPQPSQPSQSGGAPDCGARPELADVVFRPEVSEAETVYRGAVWDIVTETFSLPESETPLTRDLLAHPGAVAVVALDDAERILLIRQYRHPIRRRDWEIPAGLLDIAGEDPAAAAARELGEEADLAASEWHTLADMYSSPGGSDEALRIYLARGLSPLPAYEREAEELGIVPRWTPLDEAVEAVLSGRIANATACLGILHADAARRRGFTDLRSVDEPWFADRRQ